MDKFGQSETSPTYVENLCSIIEKWKLTQYDVENAGTDKAKTGKYTGKGVFTIMEEADGPGASKRRLLKSYQKNRNGWISLDYTSKV